MIDEVELDDAFDFARPQQNVLQAAGSTKNIPAAAAGSQMDPAALQAMLGRQPHQQSAAEQERLERQAQEKSKAFQCLYPVYFDSTRSREQGRRVKKANAVPNPLARDIVDALQHIGKVHNIPFQVVLEPVKTHPKDWANPGRIKVLVKKDGKAVNPQIHNKHHLYTLISAYLRDHPTTEDSPMRLRIQGMPMPKDNKIIPPAIPRGFKMGNILPLHSPALSGGGVSDNFMKDMMDQMGGQMPPGMEGLAGLMGGAASGGPASGQAPKKVKDKKKK
nr:signal recognition particle sec65 subunit [Quercus suber]